MYERKFFIIHTWYHNYNNTCTTISASLGYGYTFHFTFPKREHQKFSNITLHTSDPKSQYNIAKIHYALTLRSWKQSVHQFTFLHCTRRESQWRAVESRGYVISRPFHHVLWFCRLCQLAPIPHPRGTSTGCPASPHALIAGKAVIDARPPAPNRFSRSVVNYQMRAGEGISEG